MQGDMTKSMRARTAQCDRNTGLPTLFIQEGGYNLRKEDGMSGCWVDEAVGQVLSCGVKDLDVERV